MKMYKRIFGVLLCLCMLLGAVSLASATEDGGTAGGSQTGSGTTHEHPICGATHTNIGDHTGECPNLEWTAWDGLNASSGNDDISYNSGVAYVYLSKDVSIKFSLTIAGGKTLYLCLNGKTITKTSEDGTFGGAIVVKEGGKLVLCDCKPSGNEGSITHGDGIKGRGVRVGGSTHGVETVFLMYGGKISGNYVGADDPGMDGAGVQIQNATFMMYGGEISDNHVEKAGNYGGGGVNVYGGGTFTMYGGEISGNTVNGDGGGVSAFNADFKMYGGTITGNAASNMGGGVYVGRKSPVLSGGSITGNTCGANANGGGVGTYNCDAILFSGNVQITGNVKDGTITNGTLSGGTANNFYLPSGTYITITDELTGSARIGVTTENTPGVGSVKYVTIVSNGDKESLQELVTKGILSYENKNEDGSAIGLFTKSNRYSTSLRACSHDFSQWAYSDTQHWKKCANCDAEDAVNKTDHAGGTATCKNRAVCTSCNQEYGKLNTEKHIGSLSTDWRGKDDNKHWQVWSCCGAQDRNEVEAHKGTKWTDGEVTTPATCTTVGEKKYTCEVCGEVKTEEISATGHTEVTDAAVKATCTTPGKTAGKHCGVCKAVIVAQEEIPATGHTEVTDAAVKATCTTPGKTAGKHCDVCEAVIVAQEVIPATGHDWGEWTVTKEATTTAEGEKQRVCKNNAAHVDTQSLPKLPPRYYYNSTTTTTKDTTKKDNTKSPGTFDPGVGVYALTAVLSVAGMAWVGRKKH